mgnify:CR=1 FL=1
MNKTIARKTGSKKHDNVHKIPLWIHLIQLLLAFIFLTPYVLVLGEQRIMAFIGLIIITVLFLPCRYLHEQSHAFVFRLLLNDKPIIYYGLNRACCIPTQPVPVGIYRIAALAPIWISHFFSIFAVIFYIFSMPKILVWIAGLTAVFQVLLMMSDFYKFIRMRSLPSSLIIKIDFNKPEHKH